MEKYKSQNSSTMEPIAYGKDGTPVRQHGFEGDVMDLTATADDITKTGGFGATDDISSPIPIASDHTDFESYLRDVRETEGDNVAGQPAPCGDIPDVLKGAIEGVENVYATPPKNGFDITYSEVSATTDEVIRAGGFGAKDDISSFLPVASDFTDFEAHLRDAEDYEDSVKEFTRPGLGWNMDTK